MFVEPVVAKPIAAGDRKLDPEWVYEQYADFVWRSLQRCGLSSSDLDDGFQEVFIVVHTKLDSFRGDSKMTTWLFGICLRVAKKQRRFAYLRSFSGERVVEILDPRTPERALEQRQTRELVERVLQRLSPEQRAVFTMFELEQIDCAKIAETMGTPLGTVYSRLHTARERFRREFERRARVTRGGHR